MADLGRERERDGRNDRSKKEGTAVGLDQCPRGSGLQELLGRMVI